MLMVNPEGFGLLTTKIFPGSAPKVKLEWTYAQLSSTAPNAESPVPSCRLLLFTASLRKRAGSHSEDPVAPN
jgi:hypothetical protein